MNSADTKQAVMHTSECVDKIKKVMYVNTGVITFTLAIVALLVIAVFRVNSKVGFNTASNDRLGDKLVEMNARLDEKEKAYIEYIQFALGTVLDKMSKDNPSLNVPKAPTFRPGGLPPPDPSELERRADERPATPTPPPVQPRPTPLPREVRYRTKYIKVTPSPAPWYKFFKQPTPLPKEKR